MNRAYGARFFGPLPRGAVVQDCVERRRRFEAGQPGVTIVTPGRPGDRWRAVLPLGVLPDDGTTIGARSLCDLMDQLDHLYPVTEAQAGRSLDCRRDRALLPKRGRWASEYLCTRLYIADFADVTNGSSFGSFPSFK